MSSSVPFAGSEKLLQNIFVDVNTRLKDTAVATISGVITL